VRADDAVAVVTIAISPSSAALGPRAVGVGEVAAVDLDVVGPNRATASALVSRRGRARVGERAPRHGVLAEPPGKSMLRIARTPSYPAECVNWNRRRRPPPRRSTGRSCAASVDLDPPWVGPVPERATPDRLLDHEGKRGLRE
jgi:hypothetical protein